MDWKECLKRKIVKESKKDINLITSTIEIAEIKIKAAEALPKQLFIGKVTLLYDALRGYLEALAIKYNYKVYNHECFSSFLREVLNKFSEAESFDKLRKIRNSINYYGKKINKKEGEEIIKELTELINKIKTSIKYGK